MTQGVNTMAANTNTYAYQAVKATASHVATQAAYGVQATRTYAVHCNGVQVATVSGNATVGWQGTATNTGATTTGVWYGTRAKAVNAALAMGGPAYAAQPAAAPAPAPVAPPAPKATPAARAPRPKAVTATVPATPATVPTTANTACHTPSGGHTRYPGSATCPVCGVPWATVHNTPCTTGGAHHTAAGNGTVRTTCAVCHLPNPYQAAPAPAPQPTPTPTPATPAPAPQRRSGARTALVAALYALAALLTVVGTLATAPAHLYAAVATWATRTAVALRTYARTL